MKRYILFKGDNYYPSGGMLDYYKDSDDLEVIKNEINLLKFFEWVQIYDSLENKIIFLSTEIDNFNENKFEWKEYDIESWRENGL